MIYIASLYSLNAKSNSFRDTNTRQHRYEYTLKRTCELLKKGEAVYSPIVHCHEMNVKYNMPKDYTFWQKLDRSVISKSDSLIVLMMEGSNGGWKESEGMSDEIQYAKELGLKIEYLECEDFMACYD